MDASRLQRHARDLSRLAGETVTVENISGTFYVFGSELAVLRLFAVYQGNGAAVNPRVRVGYSKNLKSWYLSIEAFK